MRRALHIFGIMICALLLATACRGVIVHEWPEEPGIDPTLINATLRILPCPAFTFRDDVKDPVNTEDFFTEPQRSLRFQVNVYVNESFNKDLVYSEKFVTSYEELGSVIERSLILHAFRYRVEVWQDLTDASAPEKDFWFSTSPLTSIKVAERDVYVGAHDSKQVSAAGAEFDLTRYYNEWDVALNLDVPLMRPESKFILVSNDVQKFVKSFNNNFSTSYTDPNEIFEHCKMKVKYNGYVPTGYNVVTGQLNDAQGGYAFDFDVLLINEKEAIVAFDYVLTGPTSTAVNVGLDLYDDKGVLINTVGSVNVPISQNRISVIRGEYLTREYGGGVGINTDFDGEFNIYY